jgi:hypothetical protein
MSTQLNKTMFQIISIKRQHGQDYSHFVFLNWEIRLAARPIKMWKWFYFGYWGASTERLLALQTPWISIAISRKLRN